MTTPAPTTTIAPDVPETTTAPEITEVPETTATSEPTDDTVPTFTSEELAASLPTAEDVGEGWTDLSGPPGQPNTEPTAASGPGIGNCGGPNAVARAQAFDLVAVAQGAWMNRPESGGGSVSLYSFATEDDAAGFVAATLESLSCEEPVTWERQQGTGADQWDGFRIEGFGEGAVWAFSTVYGVEVVEVEGADNALITAQTETRTSDFVGLSFVEVENQKGLVEQYGTLVVISALIGRCCYEGYIDTEDFVEFVPTDDDMAEFADLAVPVALERLGLS